jgi:hypothetical protein
MSSSIHHNHLVIGLGGTGGNIIRSLRKLVFQNFRQEDPDNVNLRYLYVDTSAEMMGAGDPSWKILGRSVQLPERSQMLITGMDFRNVVDNLSNFPGISPWLGSREDFAEILASADAAQVVGGQKRRLGRFLFASHAAKFRDHVKDIVSEMAHNVFDGQRSSQTTFHVCCGLAGGTGSGAVIDAVSQIRAIFPGARDRIILYALLPERRPPASKAGPNYHANGYAALLELNALAVGAWKPHDVTGSGHTVRMDLQDPFNCCYLFNDENEAGVNVDVQRELPDIVASFLFQKIVEIQHIEWGESNTLLRQETFEVGSQAKYPEYSAKGKPRRSRSFFSFGIKQIAYPEEEIREYLTYSFARQSVLQLLFNKWVEGQGYKEEASNHPFEEYVRDKATMEKWYLTDERISLSEGILKGEINNKKWRTISDFWKTIIPGYLSTVLEEERDKNNMLSEFTRLCDEVYREQYRGEGVARFYETKRKGDLRDQVHEIRARIEGDLFEEWKNGAKSMYDISRLVAALLSFVEDRINEMDAKVAKQSEESDRYRENEAQISRNRKEWARMGMLSVWLWSKHKKLLSAQAECFIARYTMRTRVEGLRYARELLTTLRQELNGLASEISRCSALISKAAKSFQASIDSRCADNAVRDLSKQVVRFYEPAAVKSFTREMTTDLGEQRKQTSQVRSRLAIRIGEKQTFSAFNNRVSEGDFADILESTCQQSAIEAHQEFLARYPDRGRVLQVSLMELMRREFEGNDERLRSYINSVMAMSRNYLKLDSAQVGYVGPGIPAASDSANAVCVSNLTIIAPSAPDAREFRDKFCRVIRDATKTPMQEVTNARRPQEVTLINITNVFPARFVSVVGFLRAEYLKRVSDGGKRAFIELHAEGTGGKLPDGQEIPDLYPESYKPADLRPWVMIAEVMGLIQLDKDTTSGLDRVYLMTRDAHGLPGMQELGTSIPQMIATADASTFEVLQAAIEERLEKEYQHISKRQDLVDAMVSRMEDLAKAHKPNDPVYLNAKDGFVRAKEILNLEVQHASA